MFTLRKESASWKRCEKCWFNIHNKHSSVRSSAEAYYSVRARDEKLRNSLFLSTTSGLPRPHQTISRPRSDERAQKKIRGYLTTDFSSANKIVPGAYPTICMLRRRAWFGSRRQVNWTCRAPITIDHRCSAWFAKCRLTIMWELWNHYTSRGCASEPGYGLSTGIV